MHSSRRTHCCANAARAPTSTARTCRSWIPTTTTFFSASEPCMNESWTTLLTAGVDEAGRGPLAGPVVVAAVILDPARRIRGLADSKVLTAARRETLDARIRERAIAFSVVAVDVAEIDRYNIFQATLLGMARALAALTPAP